MSSTSNQKQGKETVYDQGTNMLSSKQNKQHKDLTKIKI